MGAIRDEGIDTERITSEDIQDETITSEDIQDEAINLPKLLIDVEWVALGGLKTKWRSLKDIAPIFFGRSTDERKVYNLSTWATGVHGVGDKYYWGIKNDTFWTKKLRIVEILKEKRHSSSAVYSKFYLVYNTENGEISYVAKRGIAIPLSEFPDDFNMAYYALDNHPLRENIFDNLDEYIVDINTYLIKKK